MSIEDKFLRYVSCDTQSNPNSSTSPSTAKQLVLADILKSELEAMGLEDVRRTEEGIVYATLPATGSADGKKYSSIGLIAHMDTAQEITGKDVKPRIIRHWNGRKIQLNDEYSMSPNDFPQLNRVIGDDIVVTDGTTLLGADDKAGVAIIMQTVEELKNEHPEHGKIMVAFTPDEEIGRGTENFDLEYFDVDFAYTIDGGDIEEVDYETFNAAQATVTIHGKSIHPGASKHLMINAAQIAAQFAMLMPQDQTPATTEGREGFIHLLGLEGKCEYARLVYIIRDFDSWEFTRRKELMKDAVKLINTQYGNVASIEIEDQYENMFNYIQKDLQAVDRAYAGLHKLGIHGKSNPVRGGTDGSMLSAKGLITPNLGTGGGNCHGRFEFASLDEMKTMVRILKEIAKEPLR